MPVSFEFQEQLIRSKGYPFERHSVTTSDGYIIEMHRIPHGREPCKEPCHRQPILLMSGLLGRLVELRAGLPEAVTRFHEHSKYDLPAQIDYVLKNTSRNDLLYLALSQGTLMFFTMMSEKPKYNDKVKAFAGLAPFNKLSHMDVDALAMLVPLADHIKRMAITLNHYEVLPQGSPLLPLARTFCALPTRSVCSFLGDGLTNLGSKYMNESRIPVYLCYLPAGTSLKNIVHFSQLKSAVEEEVTKKRAS
ncbi:hypothetical protein HPB51_024004 [Rhipicephalus microplus]|uniref:Partial AB-hydrolase lipase domain-containing protein n=1 Tax=Rhipicephalus microplus TaxID=6941 RepID=A0A9J6ECK3_RHIMP|nr:hypothetical protein HPB51_024004 [Rhipicephalus microplus]